MNNEDKGFILNVVPYREHDAMITFLGETYGMNRFVLAGYYKAGSKQGSLGQEYTKVKYRFNYRENTLNRIQTGEMLQSYSAKRSDFDWLTYVSLVSELCMRFYDDAYRTLWLNYLDAYLQDLSTTTLIKILVSIIKLSGFEPYVDGCVITGDTKIADFSIEKGGFVSVEYRRNDSNHSVEYLKAIRYLFVTDNIDDDVLKQLDVSNQLIATLIEYIQYHSDVKFNSWKLISSV